MTARLTPAVLAGLRERAKAATPGPWDHVAPASDDSGQGDWVEVRNTATICCSARPDDAEFIAAADPQTVEALVDELLALRAVVARVEALRDRWSGHPEYPTISALDLDTTLALAETTGANR